MQINVSATTLANAVITIPSSKSISNRALIIHALSGGEQMPQNLSDCDDTRVMIQALGKQDSEEVNIMAAGTAMRFLTAYFSITPGVRTITGTDRMKHRPIQILTDALRNLGAEIEYVEKEGFPPLKITGKTLVGKDITLPGNISSQYISALLMIAPMLKNGLTLQLTGDIVSRPYINLTLKIMNDFGAKACWMKNDILQVDAQPYTSTPFRIESDWSAASYWYEIVALCNQRDIAITLPELFRESYQGDSTIARLFEKLGVVTEYQENKGIPSVILRKKGKPIPQMVHDFVNEPDMAQTFVVTCAMMNIPFSFSGLQSLRIKETDRIAALIQECAKLGIALQTGNGSVLSWNGERCAPQAHPAIDTYEDHRMAMAFAPAALCLGNIKINNPEVVSKSYPHYWDDLKKTGFNITAEI